MGQFRSENCPWQLQNVCTEMACSEYLLDIVFKKMKKMRTTMALSSFFLSYHQIRFKYNIVVLIFGTDSIF